MDTTQVEDKVEYKYETKSLDEFAVLLSMGAEVVDVDRVTDARFYKFTLAGNWDMQRTALEFASKKLKINAWELCEAMRRCKSVVHNR